MATYFHIPPEGGWEERSYYVVEVSGGKGNPIFLGILYTGFLSKDGRPQGYSGIFNPTMEPEFLPLHHFQYIKAVNKINVSIPNKGKDTTEIKGLNEKTNWIDKLLITAAIIVAIVVIVL